MSLDLQNKPNVSLPEPTRRWRRPVPSKRLPAIVVRSSVPRPTLRQQLQRARNGSRGWLISAAAHLILVLMLLIVSKSLPDSIEDGDTLVVAPPEQIPVEKEQITSAEFNLPAQTSPGARAKSVTVETDLPATQQLVGLSPLDVSLDSMTSQRAGPTGEAMDLLSGGGDLLKEVGHKSGQAEFFGIRAGGNNFVFVVDSSGSMMGKKWNRACRELIQSVKLLSPKQSFCVFFFDAEMHTMFNQAPRDLQMIRATPENITKLRRWMISIRFGDDTKPLVAVKHAVRMQPDAVFLLSDGEFRDPTAFFLRSENRERDEESGDLRPAVVIHTIGFKSRAGQPVLQEVAKDNGGTYRFVP